MKVIVGLALDNGVEQIEVPEEELLRFPRGVIGFEEYSDYALLQLAPPLYLLQAVEDPHVGFVLVDAEHLDPSYPREFPEEDRSLLDVGKGERPVLLCVATVSEEGHPRSVNLRAPIAFNLAKRLGTQVILQDSCYPVRCPVRVSATGDIALEAPIRRSSAGLSGDHCGGSDGRG